MLFYLYSDTKIELTRNNFLQKVLVFTNRIIKYTELSKKYNIVKMFKSNTMNYLLTLKIGKI